MPAQRVERLMRQAGICGVYRRRRHWTTGVIPRPPRRMTWSGAGSGPTNRIGSGSPMSLSIPPGRVGAHRVPSVLRI
jgi:hypothetical protein